MAFLKNLRKVLGEVRDLLAEIPDTLKHFSDVLRHVNDSVDAIQELDGPALAKYTEKIDEVQAKGDAIFEKRSQEILDLRAEIVTLTEVVNELRKP